MAPFLVSIFLVVLILIVIGCVKDCGGFYLCSPTPSFASLLHWSEGCIPLSKMPGALIDGFFMLHTPCPFKKEHNNPPTGTTVQKERPNLTIYDSTVSLGLIMLPNKTYKSNIRVYISGSKDALMDKVLFIHGCFNLTINGDYHYLQIDSHCLIVIRSKEEIPEGACLNVCLFGWAGIWNKACCCWALRFVARFSLLTLVCLLFRQAGWLIG